MTNQGNDGYGVIGPVASWRRERSWLERALRRIARIVSRPATAPPRGSSTSRA